MPNAETAIQEMFETYLDGYNRLDAETLVGLHADPCVMVHRGEVFTITAANSLSYHQRILEENANGGAHVWEMAAIDTDLIAPNGATAKIHWIARRPDGSVLWQDWPAYVVADDGTGWKIWSNISSNA